MKITDVRIRECSFGIFMFLKKQYSILLKAAVVELINKLIPEIDDRYLVENK